ncbi:hypothetical protein [Novosphingobium sp.]|uniref:hypothetical protein n=1 Tax=Novosphingobium sp. TaxID=1874826 RepID=UPI0025F9E17F|nr:hypothetical protein [Novosphingobium sp.]
MNAADTGTTLATRAYIRRETAISMAINAALSLAFYLAVFRGTDPVPLWGLGNWVFDFVPQSFMIGLMSTLVPGALTAGRLRKRAVSLLDSATALPRRLGIRALLLALVSAIGGTIMVAAATRVAGIQQLGALAAGLLKVIYGAALAAIVTPIGLRAALARPAN